MRSMMARMVPRASLSSSVGATLGTSLRQGRDPHNKAHTRQLTANILHSLTDQRPAKTDRPVGVTLCAQMSRPKMTRSAKPEEHIPLSLTDLKLWPPFSQQRVAA